MSAVIAEIRNAVKALGYKIKICRIQNISDGRYLVTVNGEDLGIYDVYKHTFVD